MPTWLIILITVSRTLMISAGITFFYFKCKDAPTGFKTLSIFWHKENLKETKPMLTDSPGQSKGYSKVKQPLRQSRKH